MWITLALVSAFCLGFYDIMKKLSVKDNDVLTVLFLNTLFGAILMSPVLLMHSSGEASGITGTAHGQFLIAAKAFIVLGSWLLGYFAIKHLPLTIQGPVNASRPVMVLLGAMLIFSERLNAVQWCGILLGFTSLFLISRIGAREGFSFKHSRWLAMSIGAAVLGAVSALYDKFLLCHFEPLEVQAWYSFYQCIIMGSTILLVKRMNKVNATHFTWRWTILFITIFLTVADVAYFYALSLPGAMISIISMIRRGSVIIPFLYGVSILKEHNVKAKTIDLAILLVSLGLLVAGSTM